MLGGYFGQFLPLSGGSNIPMTGPLNMGGKLILNLNAIKDNQASSKIRISTGGAAGTGDTLINDSAGTTQIDVSPGRVTVENTLAVSGELTASAGNITTSSGVISAYGFTTPSFSANSTIYVDPINGDDSNTGGILTPLQSPSAAAALAVSGNLIFLMPGVYPYITQIVLPNGVSLAGSGVGVTILQPSSSGTWASGLAAFVVPGNASDISDLTVDLTQSPTTGRPACVGCNDGVSGNKQFGVNPTMHRVKCINTGTCFNYAASSISGTSYVYLEDCIWVSNNRCASWSMSPGTLTVDEFRCQHLFTYSSSVSNSNIGECVFAQAKPSRFFDCLLSMTDATNTSWSGLGYQSIDADAPVEVYGTHFITSFPNLPAPPLTGTAGIDPGYWAISNTGLTKIGGGCTINPPIQDIGASLYQTLPSPAPHSYALGVSVASGTATPWGESGNAVFEVAVDAGTLASNTVTLANVNVSANAGGTSVALTDCQKMRLRIKNTNVSSTAMTLVFGSTYNTGAFSISTIAAGKRAYLDFIYDGDNSKWDLTGYVSGL